MDCILHIGIGQAGSSSLQAHLQAERGRLAELGVLYPKDLLPGGRLGGGNHKSLAVSAMRASRQNFVLDQHKIASLEDRQEFEAHVEEVYTKQVQAHDGKTCLLSAEHFWSALGFDDEIGAMRARLDRIGLNVTQILIYLRRQSDWFESFLHQRIREGRGMLERTADAMISSPSAVQLDYPSIISKWQTHFPEAKMTPRIFMRDAMIGGDIVSDAFTITGLPNVPYLPEIKNESAVSNAGLNAILHLHQRLDAMSDGPLDTAAWRRLTTLIADHMPGSCALFPEYEMAKIDAAFAEGNDAVCREFFPERTALFPDTYENKKQESFYDLTGPEFEDLFDLIFALWQKSEAA